MSAERMRTFELKKLVRDGIVAGHETATVPESSWLAKYYAKNPERFPEVL